MDASEFEYDLKMFQGVQGSLQSDRYNESANYFGTMADDAVKQGYDGIIIRGDKNTTYPELQADNYIVFNDNQIKSATGNIGKYKKDYWEGGDISKSKAKLALLPSKKDPRKKRWQKIAIDPKDYKKHGIQEKATDAYQYINHPKYTHEWRDPKDRMIRPQTPEFKQANAMKKFNIFHH